MTKRAVIVRHVLYEGIAGYRAPLEEAGYTLEWIDVTCDSFRGIDLSAPDLVILMGGPMGVYEQEAHPWLPCEIDRVRHRIDADRPTLGICLGAQIMASAMGARVYQGAVKEIGFAPVSLTAAGADSPVAVVADIPVLHWHGDTFDIPERAEWLAASACYAHQAFRRGSNQLALQFHAEMGLDPRIDHWIDISPDGLAEQALCRIRLREDYDRLGPACVAAGQRMITEWLGSLSSPPAPIVISQTVFGDCSPR